MRILTLLFLSLFCFCLLGQSQTHDEWEEWEGLFKGLNNGPDFRDTEVGFIGSYYSLDISFKRQKEYFGEYIGRGQEFGIYIQPNLVGQVALRASLLYSQYGFHAHDSIVDLDVNLGLVRVPISLVYTFPWKKIQPQLSFGFNLGHLVHRGGYINYRSEDVLPGYWASTITSGLHASLGVQKVFDNSLIIRFSGVMSLDVVNPFDKFTSSQAQLSVGYRW